MHKTISIKVTADVDANIAPLVELLNLHPRIRTIASCEGTPFVLNGIMQLAYVNFDVDQPERVNGIPGVPDYRPLVELCFGQIAPALFMLPDVEVTIKSQQGNCFATLALPHEAIADVTQRLRSVLDTNVETAST